MLAHHPRVGVADSGANADKPELSNTALRKIALNTPRNACTVSFSYYIIYFSSIEWRTCRFLLPFVLHHGSPVRKFFFIRNPVGADSKLSFFHVRAIIICRWA